MNFRRVCAFLALAMCVALATNAVAGPISVGNLVVVQSNGDANGGAAPSSISSSATRQFVKEFTTAGASIQTIVLPTTAAGSGNRAITLSGSATSEGFIALSRSTKYLTVTGYNQTVGGANPVSSDASNVNRVVGRIEVATGSVDTTTALTDAFDQSNIRSSVSSNGNHIWLAGSAGSGLGDSGGVRYTTFGSTTSTRVNSGGSNRRVVDLFNDRIYVSANSGSFVSLSTMTSAFPTANETETVLPGMPAINTINAYDFWFKDANTAYIASESGGTTAGIEKWTLNAGTWSLQYILLNNGSSGTGVRGLTGYVNELGQAVLFATTTQTSANNLITVTDLGAGGGTATTLATAPTNTAFRGVQYISYVPEPASLVLLGLASLAMVGTIRRR